MIINSFEFYKSLRIFAVFYNFLRYILYSPLKYKISESFITCRKLFLLWVCKSENVAFAYCGYDHFLLFGFSDTKKRRY